MSLQAQAKSPIFILASSSKTRLALVKSIGFEPALVLSPDADETELKKELPQHYCMRVAEKKFDAALELISKLSPPYWVASPPRGLAMTDDVGPKPVTENMVDCCSALAPNTVIASPTMGAKQPSMEGKTAPENATAVALAADTTIACGRRMLHKSYDKAEIRQHLQLLSGRRHRAYTAIVAGLIEDGKLKTKRKKIVLSTLKFKRFQPFEIELLVESDQCEGMAGGYTLTGLSSRYLQFIQGSHSNVLGLPLYETTQMLQSLGLK